jgi:hypothetical protein
MKMKQVLYVPRLKKNLLSISALDKKGFKVAFVNGQSSYVAKREDL